MGEGTYDDHSRGESRSQDLHEQATGVFPGGVSHNIRYHDPQPLYVESASGATIRDADGNEYVDYWMNHQASILGHAYPDVVEAVQDQAADGLHYGLPNETGLEFGRQILEHFPAAERLRFTSSGTEATMYAVRIARATTGKDHILKAEGGWHGGNTDLAKGVHSPFDRQTTQGLPPGVEKHVHPFPVNDVDAVTALFEEYDVAGVIVEPMLLAGGGVQCEESFLEFLREETKSRDARLIFDEVVTGFRVSPGSYQARIDVEPDLTTFGKVAGGGLPIGGLAGRDAFFEATKPTGVAPDEAILAGGGTFTMNPMTATAGLATLDVIESEPVYEYTESQAQRVRDGLSEIFDDLAVEATVLGTSSLFCPHFEPTEPLTHVGAVEQATNREALLAFHHRLIDRGHYHLPGHMGSISYQTTEEQIEDLLASSREIIAELTAEDIL